jgi:mannosyltransferase OCH1-like enzyme
MIWWITFFITITILLAIVIVANTRPFPSPSPTWRSDAIPKIIHQTAPANTDKWHPVWKQCQKSWQKHFPDYEYKMWTDEDLDDIVRIKYPWFYPTFQNYDKKIKRIDAARYFILFEHGGIYADMDFECLRNFEHEIPSGKVSIAESPAKNDGRGETHQNALMISPPRHPFWNTVFKELEKNSDHHDVLYATGPQIIVNSIKKCDEGMVNSLPYTKYAPLYNNKDFKPLWQTGENIITAPKDNSIYTRHHGTAVWGDFSKNSQI